MTIPDESENAENWDWDSAKAREPVKARRVVLSVAFASPDFQRVASYAARIGKKTSEFVREAAMRAAPATHPTVIPFTRAGSSTSTRGPRVVQQTDDPTTSPALLYQVR